MEKKLTSAFMKDVSNFKLFFFSGEMSENNSNKP